ncbi:MAG: hypothetical protein M5U13_13165 [Thermoanaerobaculia bacterium]|nr:hypothetical protein [Thermoanaerobaculia bacterium]
MAVMRGAASVSRFLGRLWLSGVISLAVVAPVAEATAPGPGEDETLTVEALVREVYSRHERQVTASGTPLTIEITNVRVIRKSEFGDINLSDVLTVAPSHSIGITVSTRSLNGAPLGVSFPARWITNTAPDAEGEEAAKLTIEGIFQYHREAGREVQTPEAIIAFDSSVTLEGRTVAYKAYFMLPEYHPGESPREFRYHDPVLLLEPALIVEERTARTEAELREMALHAQPGPP